MRELTSSQAAEKIDDFSDMLSEYKDHVSAILSVCDRLTKAEIRELLRDLKHRYSIERL